MPLQVGLHTERSVRDAGAVPCATCATSLGCGVVLFYLWADAHRDIGGIRGAASARLRTPGHDTVLIERDPHAALSDASVAFDSWQRPGVGHFRLPHPLLALGRRLLRVHFPGVLEDLHRGGAYDIDLTLGSPPGVQRDEDLVAQGCRRPLIEWALR